MAEWFDWFVYAAGATYLTEASALERRGFVSSFQYVSMAAGQILGLGPQIILQRTLSDAAPHSWGRRASPSSWARSRDASPTASAAGPSPPRR
ncbi:hypothetical protein AQJ27_20840 [Streptomyces olivochromogenes]|uniref:MFS transporter n=1 Tax=Streptomyces olivochromogenes TaxID=1963 RepID=A0A250VBX8_STROL|nr:hypothetical protein AQJ27_20840 [Streptomyces olivochromogenes]GAX51675.1 MFS transporter [Streptomyces olivochromogenes]